MLQCTGIQSILLDQSTNLYVVLETVKIRHHVVYRYFQFKKRFNFLTPLKQSYLLSTALLSVLPASPTLYTICNLDLARQSLPMWYKQLQLLNRTICQGFSWVLLRIRSQRLVNIIKREKLTFCHCIFSIFIFPVSLLGQEHRPLRNFNKCVCQVWLKLWSKTEILFLICRNILAIAPVWKGWGVAFHR